MRNYNYSCIGVKVATSELYTAPETEIVSTDCAHPNAPGAAFCSQCGLKLGGTKEWTARHLKPFWVQVLFPYLKGEALEEALKEAEYGYWTELGALDHIEDLALISTQEEDYIFLGVQLDLVDEDREEAKGVPLCALLEKETQIKDTLTRLGLEHLTAGVQLYFWQECW